MHKKLFITVALIGLVSLAPGIIYAVGGGGGGSVPSCAEDRWECGSWSQCSESGTQIRVCEMTYDCPTASTAKPEESQACSPPAPPPAEEVAPTSTKAEESAATSTKTKAGESAATATKAQEKKPEEPPKPICTEDVWECGGWSASCDIYGREKRSCKISFDCPTEQTLPPIESRACQKIQCGNKAELRDRIACRLNLAPAGAARELQLQYLPEACRAQSGGDKTECIERYRSFQSCWNVEEGEKRFSCARNILRIGPPISEEVKLCRGKTGADQAVCKEGVKEKILYMILFRFYDLESRAEELGNRGADLEALADFETVVELKKQEFEQAADNKERRQIILDVRLAWQSFINRVKDQVK